MRHRMMLLIALAAAVTGSVAAAQGPTVPPPSGPAPQSTKLDLAAPFHARSPWRLVVAEGPQVKEVDGDDAPGALTLCLNKGPTAPCVSDPVTLQLRAPSPDYAIAWEPHYLKVAKVVYRRGPKAAPLLLIVTGSLYSGDGDQVVSTQLISYDPVRDTFQRIYSKTTGHNNNQEVRFITGGPLQGDVIVAEPQDHLPYGYWIMVNKPTAGGSYRQVLRYRSATLYNDGNQLAVIDSEMPNIESRRDLWRPGDPIPTPQFAGDGKPCLKPTLKHTELWCD